MARIQMKKKNQVNLTNLFLRYLVLFSFTTHDLYSNSIYNE